MAKRYARSAYRMTSARRAALRKAQLASARKRKRNRKVKKAVVAVGAVGVIGATVGVGASKRKKRISNNVRSQARARVHIKKVARQRAEEARRAAEYAAMNHSTSINYKISQSPILSATLRGKTPVGGAAESRIVNNKKKPGARGTKSKVKHPFAQQIMRELYGENVKFI